MLLTLYKIDTTNQTYRPRLNLWILMEILGFTYLNKNFSSIYWTTLSQAQICLQIDTLELTQKRDFF